MIDYFLNCPTLEEGKKRYREYAKKLHPDLGGSTEQMVELTRQWEKFEKSKPQNTNKQYEDAFYDGRTKWDNTSRSTSDRFGWKAPNAGAGFYGGNTEAHEMAKLKMKLMVFENENRHLKEQMQELNNRYQSAAQHTKFYCERNNDARNENWNLRGEINSLKDKLAKANAKLKAAKPKRKYTKRTKVSSPESETIFL